MTRPDDNCRERAVSDLTGFAIIFGIVIISIGLVFTFGVGALDEAQRGEAIENVERAFDIIAVNIADIHQNGAPARSTELDVATGQVAVTERVVVNVSISSQNFNDSLLITPISYAGDGTEFHYVSGAVVRTSRSGPIIVREPPFRFSDSRVVLSFVQTSARGDTTSIGGSSVRVRARRNGASILVRETGGVTFNFGVQSQRYRAWEDYFRREANCDAVSVDQANNTAVCEYTTETLLVRQTSVKISLTD